jgi:hypothetical protein
LHKASVSLACAYARGSTVIDSASILCARVDIGVRGSRRTRRENVQGAAAKRDEGLKDVLLT